MPRVTHKARPVTDRFRKPDETLAQFQAKLWASWFFRAAVANEIFEPLNIACETGDMSLPLKSLMNRWEFKSRNNGSDLDKLVALALSDEEQSIAALWSLRHRGTRDVFEIARALCLGGDGVKFPSPRQRQLGVCILSQITLSKSVTRQNCVDVLLRLLEIESDQTVEITIIYALGYLKSLTQCNRLPDWIKDESLIVRYAVAEQLKHEKNIAAIDCLISLSYDECDEVRDQATFGLGFYSSYRHTSINRALLDRLSDYSLIVRLQAMDNLLERKRARKQVLETLKPIIASGNDSYLAIEIATKLASPELYADLLKLRTDKLDTDIEEAIKACRPVGLVENTTSNETNT